MKRQVNVSKQVHPANRLTNAFSVLLILTSHPPHGNSCPINRSVGDPGIRPCHPDLPFRPVEHQPDRRHANDHLQRFSGLAASAVMAETSDAYAVRPPDCRYGPSGHECTSMKESLGVAGRTDLSPGCQSHLCRNAATPEPLALNWAEPMSHDRLHGSD